MRQVASPSQTSALLLPPPTSSSSALLGFSLSLAMELALPLPCYLLGFCLFGLSAGSLPRSYLATYENGSFSEIRERCEGIVLITTNRSSKLVCDDQWSVDSTLARVVCQESGCGKPNHTWTLQSALPFSLEFVQGLTCTGNEATVEECEESEETVQNCTLPSIAAITCNPNVLRGTGNHSMRLSKGRNPCDGHVEVFIENMWNPVCYTGVKETDPEVLCQQMDCKSLRPIFSAVHKGKSPGAVLFECPVNQSSVWECDCHKVDICQSGLTTYLQCNRPRMEESWLVWTAICLAAVMIIAFCWVRATKSWKNCIQTLHRSIRSCISCPSNTRERCRQNSKRRRNIYEPPNLIIQEARSPPSSPGALQNPTEVNALLAPHGFRLNNTITPPPSYMHALKVLSRPLENSQTPPPSYLEALKVLSRPVLVHVHAAEDYEEKENLTTLSHGEKEGDTHDS